jgi:uncharacterized protein YndB with AHSA1/START domain
LNEYETVTTIRAAPETVWGILTDAGGYADWNPEIVGVDGRIAPGARITARVKVSGGAVRSVGLRVTAFEAPARMEWTGGLPLGLFVGRRTFTVTRLDGVSEFRMHLRMSGPLSPMIIKSVGDRQSEIDSFAASLKARAEQHLTASTQLG